VVRLKPVSLVERDTFLSVASRNGDDFEATFRDRPTGRGVEETIEKICVSGSYVMVDRSEIDPSLTALYREPIDAARPMLARHGQIADPALRIGGGRRS
jgi:hypothetical protein